MIEYPFDPNNEESRVRQKIEEYYGDFSDSVRNKLFSKNIERPTSAYDLVYPRQRESLLTKNETSIFDKNLDETSVSIRNSLISHNITEQIDLIKTGESARKSLLARNKIIEEGDKLFNKTESVRNSLLSKNEPNRYEIEDFSKKFRDDLISKNVNKKDSDLKDNSEILRDDLIAKNKQFKGNESILLNDSDTFRDLNISKSKNKETNLENKSDIFRKENLSKNKKDISLDQGGDLEVESENFRNDLLSKNNNDKEIPLDLLFESTREILLSKGASKGIGLEDVSDAFRDALISKNTDKTKDLSEVFNEIRKNLISSNDFGSGSIESDSEKIRKDILSKNEITNSSLENLSKDIREALVSKNIEIKRKDIVSLYDSVRNGIVSANESKDIDLISMFNEERKNLLSANELSKINLENESFKFRKENLSKSERKNTDIESFSKSFRDDVISKNESSLSDLESFSSVFRKENVSSNEPVITNLESDSVVSRESLISSNVPGVSDIESDSVVFRSDLTSSNVPSLSDIENDSVTFRDDLTSSNVPSVSDIETDSVNFRDDLISSNVPNISDIETDSVNFREGLFASNVPNVSNIETDSVNFRDGLLGSNVYQEGDFLLSKSQDSYFNNISSNISNNGLNLLLGSEDFRESNLSNNSSNTSDLLRDSSSLRDQLKARNNGGLLGVNINAAGTSTFLGVSRVLTQGILYRALLLPKNKYRKNRDEYDVGFDRDSDNRFTKLNGSSKVTDQSGSEISNDDIRVRFGYGPTSTSIDTSLTTSDRGALSLFGTGTRNDTQSYDLNRDGKYYGEKSSISLPGSDQTLNSTILGSITKAARDYNISRNNFSINGDSGLRNLNGFDVLTNTNLVPGTSSTGGLQPALFEDLIQKTVGSIKNPESDSLSTPTTPFGVILENEGKYLKADPSDSMRPSVEAFGGDLDSNPSLLMAKTVVENPFYEESFQSEIRGVRSVINRIKKNTNIEFASNYDPQNSLSYATGLRPDKSIKRVGQRWTVKNPYAPGEAKSLHFMLENYSNNQKLYLPPYITSFQHGSSVSWNEHNFLGRPEALYTYSSSKRSGSISFFVLTDYAQEVEMGLRYDNQNGEVSPYKERFNESFTQVFNSETVESEIKKIDKEIDEVNEQMLIAGDSGETAGLERKKSDLQETKSSLQKNKDSVDRNKARQPEGKPVFSESNRYFRNIYTDVIKGLNGNTEGVDNQYVDSKPENTEERLSYMKRQLMFQPSYFSGDKIDFLKRMEFLEKMTRPSRAPDIKVEDSKGVGDDKYTQRPGFSFINPPICHIHLGDWINHDVVINSIDYDYTDSPWTTGGGGRVQPMWCQVTMSFDMIGRYKHAAGDAVLSTDRGGFFSI